MPHRTVCLVVGLALALVSIGSSPTAPAAHADERTPPRFVDADREIKSALRDVPLVERRRRARLRGPVHLRGRERLSGRVFADALHVHEGAEVSVDRDTVIWVRGDVVVRGVLRAADKSRGPRAKKDGTVGEKGENGASVKMKCDDGNMLIEGTIFGGGGGDGESVVVVGRAGRGGFGGGGGNVTLACKGTITIAADIVGGLPGDGGNATVTGAPPVFKNGGSARAVGGDGGRAGTVRIKAKRVVFETDGDGNALGRIVMPLGGNGGIAVARGSAGKDALLPGSSGGHGGSADASGGDAGRSGDGRLDAKELEPLDFDALDIIQFQQDAGFGRGGDAEAYGAFGGAGADGGFFLGPPDPCPKKGPKGGKGGRGGGADAHGGRGSRGGRFVGRGVLRQRTVTSAEGPGGDGSDAIALGAGGGNGGDGHVGKKAGAGGAGGEGGPGAAIAGRPGTTRSGVPTGTNGSVTGVGGNGGDGGKGGDCCENPGGPGGAGGDGGTGGRALATAGTVIAVTDGADGAAGAAGDACDAAGNIDFELPDDEIPAGEDTTIELDLLNHDGRPVTGVRITICKGKKDVHDERVSIDAADDGKPGRLKITFIGKVKKPGKSQKYKVKVDGRNTGSFSVKGVDPDGGGGGDCSTVTDGNPDATFEPIIFDGENIVYDGRTVFGPLPTGRTLTIEGGFVVDRPGGTLNNATLSVSFDGRTLIDRDLGTVQFSSFIGPIPFSLPDPGPGCLEITIKGDVETRTEIGTTN